MTPTSADIAVYRRRRGARPAGRPWPDAAWLQGRARGRAARQGLERLQQGGIDVIALDQYMPGLDGLETLEQILAIPDAPPVVFVTASQDSSDRRHCAEGGRRRLSGQGYAGRFHSAASGRR